MSSNNVNRNNNTNKNVFGDNNNKNYNNKSFNKTINITQFTRPSEKHKSVERPGLKELKGKGERVFYGFCLGSSQFKSKYEGYVNILVVNIHYNNTFKADHLHLHVKEEIYNDYYKNKIIEFTAEVNPYLQDNEECYSLIVSKINRCYDQFNIEDYYIPECLFDDDVELIRYKDEYFELPIENRRKILFNLFKEINLLFYREGICNNFISDFILMHFLFNKDYRILSLKDYEDINIPEESVIQLSLLCSRILFVVQNKYINDYKSLFDLICDIINKYQGIYRKFTKNKDIDELRDFCLTNNIPYGSKIYSLVKRRMNNYEFNEVKSENEIHDLYFILWCQFKSYRDINAI